MPEERRVSNKQFARRAGQGRAGPAGQGREGRAGQGRAGQGLAWARAARARARARARAGQGREGGWRYWIFLNPKANTRTPKPCLEVHG